MEENNDIFLVGGDTLLYLSKPVHKIYSTKLFWGHPFSSHVSNDQFFNFPSPCTHLYTFLMTPFYSPSCLHT